MVPHAPQLFGSRVVSTQEVPHFTAPPLQTSWHAEPTQV